MPIKDIGDLDKDMVVTQVIIMGGMLEVLVLLHTNKREYRPHWHQMYC
tara:strand:- start:486 stop:629 length:144 start_codon:yes stop_codon:yes gene_type:complete